MDEKRFPRMCKKYENLTIDEWKIRYQPINTESIPIEGVSFEFLKTQNPLHMWTMCDDGETCIIESGWHTVNAIGVYLTIIPHDEDIQIFVYEDKDYNENVILEPVETLDK